MRNYKRVLVPTDFSPASRLAAEEGVEFARQRNAELVLLNVVEHFPEHLPHYQIAHEEKDPQEFILDRAQKDLASLADELGAPDATKEVRVTKQSAKAEILRFASDENVDLIVIGSRGRDSLLDRLSGSTATGVVRSAPCNVYVVQDHED